MSEKEDSSWKPQLSEIVDVLVEGYLPARSRSPEVSGRHPSGKFWVRVGRPFDHEGVSCCPLIVEGFFTGVKPVFGVTSLDSLMNAMALVKRYFNHANALTDEPLPSFE